MDTNGIKDFRGIPTLAGVAHRDDQPGWVRVVVRTGATMAELHVWDGSDAEPTVVYLDWVMMVSVQALLGHAVIAVEDSFRVADSE